MEKTESQCDWYETSQQTELLSRLQMQIEVRVCQCNYTWIKKSFRDCKIFSLLPYKISNAGRINFDKIELVLSFICIGDKLSKGHHKGRL